MANKFSRWWEASIDWNVFLIPIHIKSRLKNIRNNKIKEIMNMPNANTFNYIL